MLIELRVIGYDYRGVKQNYAAIYFRTLWFYK